MRRALLLLIVLLSGLEIAAQNTMITVGNGHMQGTCTERTSDRGFLFAAYDYYGGQRMVFIKTDSTYATEWAFSTPEPVPYNYQFDPFVIKELPDGSYAVLVASSSTVMRISSSGNLVWRREFCDLTLSTYFYNTYFYGMTVDHRGQIILSGDCLPQPANLGKVGILQAIDTSGTVLWRNQYIFGAGESLVKVTNANDGGFTVVGTTSSPGTHVFFIHTDSVGNMLWTTRYPVPDFEFLTIYDLIQGSDGSYVAVGRTAVLGPGLAMKFDVNGAYQWSRTYGDSTSTWFFDVIETESEYVICGSSSPQPNCGYHGLLMGLNKVNGNKNWHSVLGDPINWSSYHTMYYHVEETATGFLAAGYSDLLYPLNTTDFDAVLVSTDNVGQIPCWNYNHPLPLVPHAPLAAVAPGVNVSPGTFYATWIAPATTSVLSVVGSACPLSVTENDASTRVSIYPNPSDGKFTLQGGDRKLNIEIRNMSGQLLQTNTLTQEANLIDMTDFAAGMYVITVMDENEIIHYEKVIIE